MEMLSYVTMEHTSSPVLKMIFNGLKLSISRKLPESRYRCKEDILGREDYAKVWKNRVYSGI